MRQLMRKKYDSSVIFLYNIGKEKILPERFRSRIPYSTISTWRKTNYSDYEGHEFRRIFEHAFLFLELNSRYQQSQQSLKKVFRSWVAISHILLPVIRKAGESKSTQKQVLTAINHLRDQLGIDRALRLLGISKTQYYQWTLEARFECFDSFTQLCVKRHPQQLQLAEIVRIKKLLTDPAFSHWPIVSVAGDALRKKEVVASLYSWYKYAKLFGVYRKIIKKQRKTVGLQATCPNEYWHVDTTFYELIDGSPVCISFVMDNFSKMILGYHVARRNTFDLVRKALKNTLKMVRIHSDVTHSFLVTDGGRENHNQYIDSFIAKLSNHRITKIRALKDIRFSNSPVEAIHRSIKGRYLRNRKFESLRAIDIYLRWAVNDYNAVRPHYKHRPRTPEEVYFGRKLDFDIRERVTTAISERVEANKKTKCIQCTGLCAAGACELAN
jgi:hypothetical protein